MIRPKIRVAGNEDSPAIQAIMEANGFLIKGLDWSDIGRSWLVAKHRGKVIGTIQVLIGRPLAFIGYWAVLPEYHHSGVGIYLWKTAERLLADAGCDGFMGFSDNERVLKKLPEVGGLEIGEYSCLIKRIWRGKNGQQAKNSSSSASASAT